MVYADILNGIAVGIAQSRASLHASMGKLICPTGIEIHIRDIRADRHTQSGEVLGIEVIGALSHTNTVIVAIEIQIFRAEASARLVMRVDE